MSNPYEDFDECGLWHVPTHLIESELWEQYEQFLTDFHYILLKIVSLSKHTNQIFHLALILQSEGHYERDYICPRTYRKSP